MLRCLIAVRGRPFPTRGIMPYSLNPKGENDCAPWSYQAVSGEWCRMQNYLECLGSGLSVWVGIVSIFIASRRHMTAPVSTPANSLA